MAISFTFSCPDCCQCWVLTKQQETSAGSGECENTTGTIKMYGHSGASVGSLIQIGSTCWKVTSQTSDCHSAVNEMGSIVSTCTGCITPPTTPVCWLLKNCADSSDTITTDTDMSTYLTTEVVKITGGGGKCYELSGLVACPQNPTSVTVEETFDCCVICTAGTPCPTGDAFTLTDCDGNEAPIVTSIDLATITAVPSVGGAYALPGLVGQVVKISGYTNCWTVTEGGVNADAVAVTITDVFESCADCFGCTGSPTPCGGCCFSEGSKVIANHLDYTCDWWSPAVCADPPTFHSGNRYNSGSNMTLEWHSNCAWRTLSTVVWDMTTSAGPFCGNRVWGHFPQNVYFWVRYDSVSGFQWNNSTTTTKPVSGWTTYTTTQNGCCSADTLVDGPCVTNSSLFKNYTAKVINNGCCKYTPTGKCKKGTDFNCDGDCESIVS